MCTCVVLLVVVACPAAYADSAPGDESIFDILSEDARTSTGSRLGTTALESPSSVWVIDRAEIERSAAFDITDLLRRIPGIVPLQYVAGDTEIAVRGMGVEAFNHVLFLIDGRSVGTDYYNTSDVHELSVAIEDIERIEAVVGPASTTYGANAFSAVINIITRDPTHEGWRVRAAGRGGIGTIGLASPVAPLVNKLDPPQPIGGGFLEYSQAFSKLRVRASLSGDHISAATAQPGDLRLKEGVPLPNDKLSGMIDVRYEVNEWSLEAQGFAGYKKSNYMFTILSQPGRSEWKDFALNLLAQKKRLFGEGDELTLQLWVRRFNNDWKSPIGLGYLDLKNDVTSTEMLAQYATPTFFKNRLVVGLQARLIALSALGLLPGASPEGLIGVFAEDQFRPISPLIFTAGVRVETRQMAVAVATGKFNVSPRVAAVYIPSPGHSVRLELATAYRIPSPNEQLNPTGTLGVIIVDANRNLLSEQNIVGTLSYQGTFSWLKPRAEVFVGYRPHLITLAPTPSGGLPYTYQNANDTESWGGSLQLLATVNRFVDLWAFYSYSQARALNTITSETRFENKFASLVPAHMAGLGGSLVWDRLTVGLQIYVSSPALDPAQSALSVYAPVQGRVMINPLVKYAIDAAHRFQVLAAATNVGDIRFGAGANRDAINGAIERIGPRVWVGLDVNFPGETRVTASEPQGPLNRESVEP